MAPARARRLPLEARLLTSLAARARGRPLTTPLAIRVAHRFEFYDRPVGYKGHAAPTPYLGGAAVVAGFRVVALLLAGRLGAHAPAARRRGDPVGRRDGRRPAHGLRRSSRVAVELALGVGAVGARARLGPRARAGRRPRGHARSGSSPWSTRSTCSTTWTAPPRRWPRSSPPAWPCSASRGATPGWPSRGRAGRGVRSASCRTTSSRRRRGSSSATAAACRSASRSPRWR